MGKWQTAARAMDWGEGRCTLCGEKLKAKTAGAMLINDLGREAGQLCPECTAGGQLGAMRRALTLIRNASDLALILSEIATWPTAEELQKEEQEAATWPGLWEPSQEELEGAGRQWPASE